MPLAARVSDPTNHPGAIGGPGALTVFIEKMPAARVGDLHTCALSPTPHPPNKIEQGSMTVYIGKQQAARQFDLCSCGAAIAGCAVTVNIG